MRKKNFLEASNGGLVKQTATSTRLDLENYKKLRAISFWSRATMQDLTSVILKYFVNKYEDQHGPIKPIPEDPTEDPENIIKI
ncbi:MAG: hypothetical protein ACYC2U_00235 [Candidatus Amoebophilus sp.]